MKSAAKQVPEAQPARKKVLFLAPQPFFANRGTPFNVREILITLSDAGYEVDLLAYPFGEEIELDNLSINRSFSCGFSSVPIGPSLRKIILDIPFFFKALLMALRGDYDLIHGIEEAGVIAALLSKLKKCPYIFDMDSCMTSQLADHKSLSNPLFLKVVSAIEGRSIRNADAVLTVCTALTEKAREFSDSVPIYQIEDFPLEKSEDVDSALVEQLREEFFLDGKRLVVYTGNFETYQGIDLLVESFALIAQDFPDVYLFLVGGGELGSEIVKKYQAKVSDLGISEQVIFAGYRPNNEMGAFMALSEVLASPRLLGGNTPLKLFSYMEAGRAVVATSIKAHTTVLDDSSAYLAEPEPKSYSEALAEALSAGERREKVVVKAKDLADNRYSRESFRKRVVKLYSDILE